MAPIDPTAQPAAPRYWAFICYSHADDAFAARLHRALESYVVPRSLVGKPHRDGVIPRRLLPVFRDREELPGAASLSLRIRNALSEARYLVVICSPRAAASPYVNEEIRTFKSLGRADRIISVIVGGEPHAGTAGPPEKGDCFPPALCRAIRPDGRLLDDESEPIAADARAGKDGRRNAVLKVLAGILEVGFDDLWQRERRRVRARRVGLAALAIFLLVASLAVYIGLADANVNLRGSADIRATLDHRGLTVFRRPYSDRKIREAAAAQRRRLVEALLRDRPDGIQYYIRPRGTPPRPEPWSTSQLVAGLVRAPELDHERALIACRALERLLTDEVVSRRDGAKAGWTIRPGHPSQGAILGWYAAAVCSAASRRDVLSDQERARLAPLFQDVREMARLYEPLDDGGWNLHILQNEPADHNCYMSVLLLQALLDARDAGLDWDDSVGGRDGRVAGTARWLIAAYDGGSHRPGWRRGPSDPEPVTFDGLTLQGYAALLRAEAAGGVRLPGDIQEHIVNRLVECGGRDHDFPTMTVEFETTVIQTGPDGETGKGIEFQGIEFQWYPWAIQAAVLWLDRAERAGAPAEKVLAVRRTIGHLVVDLGDDAIEAALQGSAYIIGELLYGLSAIAPPDAR